MGLRGASAAIAPWESQSNMQRRKLIFLHIPKTGGMTLINEILARNLPAEELRTDIKGTKDYQDFLDTPLDEKEKLACVGGHIFFGVHESFKSPCRYVAFVRHPVGRIISNYYFTKRNQGHPRHAEARTMPLEQYVLSKDDIELSNVQVRLLAGFPEGRLDETDLVQARANIEKHFACVGITDQFDASLLLMAKLLGFKNIHYTPWNIGWNKKTPRTDRMEEVRQAILSRNQLDLDLYNFCAKRLERQLAENGIDQASVLRYQEENAAQQDRDSIKQRQKQERLDDFLSRLPEKGPMAGAARVFERAIRRLAQPR